MSINNETKRINITVNVEKYARLKKILDLMGITITDFFDQSITDFIENMEQIVLNQDKEEFLKLMTKNLESIQKEIEKEFQKKD